MQLAWAALLLLLLGSCPSSWAAFRGNPRVVGGTRVPIESATYMAALLKNGQFTCGAALLTPRCLLTAAHCVLIHARYEARAGHANFQLGTRRSIWHVVRHGAYSAHTLDNDIALAHTKDAFRLGPTVSLVQLPRYYQPPCTLLVSGWGTSSENGTRPRTYLRAALVHPLSQSTCSRHYGRKSVAITQTMLCAGAMGSDHCYGDSGGPLVNGQRIYGIVSFALGCAQHQYPGVYTRVFSHVPWIRQALRSL